MCYMNLLLEKYYTHGFTKEKLLYNCLRIQWWLNYNFRRERSQEMRKYWWNEHCVKVSVFGAILVRIFPHSDWIRRDTVQTREIRTRITTPNMDTFYAVEMKSWNWEKARNFHFYFSCYSLNIEKNKNDRRTKLQLFSFTVQFHASSYFLYFVHDCWFLFQSFNLKFCPQQPLLLKKIKTAAINRIITVKSE